MIPIKIGRHIYKITGDDKFMDNGRTVQLLTQSTEAAAWGFRPNPVLSKKAIKQIFEHKRKVIDTGGMYEKNVIVFSLDI